MATLSSHKNQSAFSLIEIAFAVAIIAFALVGILGLFPVAMDSATNSQSETQAALIARKIYSELEGETPFIRKDGKSPIEPIDLKVSTSQPYKIYLDEAGLLIDEKAKDITTANLTLGVPIYEADLAIKANTTTNLTQVELTVKTPANVKKESQQTYQFISLLNAL